MRKLPRKNDHSDLGASIGLRPIFRNETQEQKFSWIEIITDNYLNVHKRHWNELEIFRKDSELVCHGVGLNIGGTDELDFDYLLKLKDFFNHFEPAWVSDHMCWTSILGHQSFDLLPLPYNQESLKHLTNRIQKVQDFTKREWVFENPSVYLEVPNSEMSEGEFFKELHGRTGCRFLLDLNNIQVTSYNLKIDSKKLLAEWPLDAVSQIHLAGGSYTESHLIDTHNQIVESAVWDLFKELIKKTGPLPTLIEWDRDFPEFQVLMRQQQLAQGILNESARIPEAFLPAAP